MKCLLALIALLFSLTLADYPLYIDELGDLVSDADERMLDVLDDDEFTPRWQLLSFATLIFLLCLATCPFPKGNALQIAIKVTVRRDSQQAEPGCTGIFVFKEEITSGHSASRMTTVKS